MNKLIAGIHVTTENVPALSGDAILSGVVNAAYVISGMVAVIALLVSSFRYITAAGDPKKLAKAKDGVLYSIIGIIVVLGTFGILGFVLEIFTNNG